MRDSKRIKRILTKIGILWSHYPDQRFFQLLSNYTRLGVRKTIGSVNDPFHYEDDETERYLDKELVKIYDRLERDEAEELSAMRKEASNKKE